jgi:hypothetical protein
VKHSSPENRDKQGCSTLDVYLYNAAHIKKQERKQPKEKFSSRKTRWMKI